MAIIIKEDIFKTGFKTTRNSLIKARDSLVQANKDLAVRVSKEGVEIVNHWANALVEPQEDVTGFAAKYNSAMTVSSGINTNVIIFNFHPEIPFIEFGTGKMGETTYHPKAHEHGWGYYIPTIYKTELRGYEGWWYGGHFRRGITSAPFYYQSAQEIRRVIGKWFAEEFENRMKEGA